MFFGTICFIETVCLKEKKCYHQHMLSKGSNGQILPVLRSQGLILYKIRSQKLK